MTEYSALYGYYASSRRWKALGGEGERELYRKFFYNAKFTVDECLSWSDEGEDFLYDAMADLSGIASVGRDEGFEIIWQIKAAGNIAQMRALIIGSVSDNLRLRAMMLGAIVVTPDDDYKMDKKAMMKLIVSIKAFGDTKTKIMALKGMKPEEMYEAVKNDIDADLLLSSFS